MSKKLSRVFLLTAILIVSLCMAAFVAITQTRTVSAANADFTMVDGAALRISDDDGGIRFRVKMNAATANKFKNGDAELKIAIAPKAIFATVTDGNYAELSQKIELTADKNKIYQDGDYYYANGVISNILEENRKLDFCAVAYYTEGNNTVYASFNADVTCGNVYDIVNQLVVSYGDTYADEILKCKSYEWYGVGDYPILINTVEQYNALAAQVNNGRDFSKYTALVADEVKSASGKTEISDKTLFPTVLSGYCGELVVKSMLVGATKLNVSAPEGYAYQYQVITDETKTAQVADVDVSQYSKLSLKIKGSSYVLHKSDWLWYTYGGVTSVEMKRINAEKWSVVYTGEYLFDGSNVNIESKTDERAGNELSKLLDLSVYAVGDSIVVTEVRGEKFEVKGNVVAESFISGASKSSESVAVGYQYSYEYIATKANETVTINSVDVSSYGKLYLQMKATGYLLHKSDWSWFTDDGGVTNVEMTKISAGLWQVTFSGDKLYKVNFETKVDSYTTEVKSEDLKDLLSITFYGAGNKVVISELRGDKIQMKGESVAESVVENSVKSSAAAPLGYEHLYELTATDTVLTATIKSVDISAYSKLYLKIKTTGIVLLNDWSLFVNKGEVDVEITRIGISTWRLNFVGNPMYSVSWSNSVDSYTIEKNGNDLKDILTIAFYENGDNVIITELRGEIDNRYNTNSAKWTESHWFETEDTENYMLKDGQTEYTVVIPSAPSGMINYAKEELNAFFLKQRG